MVRDNTHLHIQKCLLFIRDTNDKIIYNFKNDKFCLKTLHCAYIICITLSYGFLYIYIITKIFINKPLALYRKYNCSLKCSQYIHIPS